MKQRSADRHASSASLSLTKETTLTKFPFRKFAYVPSLKKLAVGSLIRKSDQENYHHFDLIMRVVDRATESRSDYSESDLDETLCGWLVGDDATLVVQFDEAYAPTEQAQIEALQAISEWAGGRFDIQLQQR